MKQVTQRFDEAIDIKKMTEHPKNPRRGSDSAVAESIDCELPVMMARQRSLASCST